MTTIKEVAAAAGVQPATVSYVMNGTGAVSQVTRERILAIAAQLNYAPSHLARSLQRRASRTLGLVLPMERSGEYGSLLLEGIADGAATRGYDLLLASHSDGGETATYAALWRSRRVDGLMILDVHHEDERVSVARDLGIPYVCVGRPGDDSPCVAIDVEAATMEALAHLIVLGHERIGLITPPLELAVAGEQDTGYRTALAEAGIPWLDQFVVEGGTTEVDGQSAAAELLSLPELPTAILAGSAALAFGTMRAVYEAGLTVGADLALIAWDDPPSAAFMVPPLTTVRQPVYQLGRAGAELLAEIIEGHEQPREVILQAQLIVRQSCGEVLRHR